MFLAELTPTAASEYLAWVIETEDAFLTDLASWMHATGGPIKEIDGTFKSLEPLWEWFKTFLNEGSPGVPPEARPAPRKADDQLAFGELNSVQRERAVALYASQGLARYQRWVFRSLDPSAHWATYNPKTRRGTTALEKNDACIVFRPPETAIDSYAVMNFDVYAITARYLDLDEHIYARNRLRLAAQSFVPDGVNLDQEARPSVLEPLLTGASPSGQVLISPLTPSSWS